MWGLGPIIEELGNGMETYHGFLDNTGSLPKGHCFYSKKDFSDIESAK